MFAKATETKSTEATRGSAAAFAGVYLQAGNKPQVHSFGCTMINLDWRCGP